MNDKPAFIHAEADLAKQLGLSRSDVRTWRAANLEQGEDWQSVKGSVFYTDLARSELLAGLKIAAPAVAAGSGVSGAAAEPPLPADLAPNEPEKNPPDSGPTTTITIGETPFPPAGVTVMQFAALAVVIDGKLQAIRAGQIHELVMVRTWRNPHVVQATFGGAPQRVTVRSNAKLLAGMKMKCRYLQADLWELAQPLPKRRGHW